MRLLDFEKNIFSQSGEDGILEKALSLLPARDKWCVEFGAWDGQLFSNTCNLIDNSQYSAVMIEADKERHQELLARHGKNPRVIGLQAFVGFTADDSLDHLLARTPIPNDFDLLSIDIDGNDYHVWKATAVYKPKMVVIEFNPTMPGDAEYVQDPDPAKNEGASVLSLTRLGKAKGYELVAITALNAIFVREEYFPLFGIENNSIGALREDTSHLTYLASTYDGKIIVMGHGKMPWHDVRYSLLVRHLPKILQKYPPFLSPTRLFFLKQYKSLLKRLYSRREISRMK